MRKIQAQKAENVVEECTELCETLEKWLSKAGPRLSSANNDQSCLKNLREEMKSKGEQLSKIREMSSELQVQQISHDSKLVKDLTEKFESFREKLESLNKDSLPRNKLGTEPGVELVRKVNAVREGIAMACRKLNAPPLSGADFQSFPDQEAALQSVNEAVTELKTNVDAIEKSRDACMKASGPDTSAQLRRVIDKLREEWSQLNRAYGDRHGKWLRCNETWKSLKADCKQMNEWIATAEEILKTPSRHRHVDLEKQATMKHRIMNLINTRCEEIILASAKNEMADLESNVSSLRIRWKSLLASLQAAKER